MSLDVGFIKILQEFPVTNHLEEVGSGNLGWVRGVFDDGLPFEAELWEHDGEKNVSVLVPIDCPISPVGIDKEDNETENLVPFQTEQQYVNGGVLAVGMILLGDETDDKILYSWVYYLEEKGLINFIGKWMNGAVQYVEDRNGNTFAQIIVELEDEDMVYATMDVQWNEFPSQKKKHKFTII